MVFPWNDETFFLGRRPAWFIAVFINYNAFRSTSQCFTIVEGFLSNLSMLIYIVCIRFNFPICSYFRASNVYTIKKNLTVPGYKINLLDEFLLKKKKREKIATSKKKSYKQLSRVNHRADKHRAKTRALEQKVSSWPSHWSRSRVTLVFLFFPHFYIKSDNLLLFTNYSMALLRHTVFSLSSHSLSLSLLSRIFFLIFLLVRFNFLRASFRF